MPASRTRRTCPSCGRRRPLEREHIIPRGRGGCDCEVNLLGLCHECHMRKHTVGIVTFYAQPNLRHYHQAAAAHHIRRETGGTGCGKPSKTGELARMRLARAWGGTSDIVSQANELAANLTKGRTT